MEYVLSVKKKYQHLIDLVSEFGVGVLNENQKTPTIQYLLYAHRQKIADHNEYRIRSANSELNEKKIRSIVLSMTGSIDEADKAAAYLTLQKTKPAQK